VIPGHIDPRLVAELRAARIAADRERLARTAAEAALTEARATHAAEVAALHDELDAQRELIAALARSQGGAAL